jgi:hydroxyacylglutathione hydrolase
MTLDGTRTYLVGRVRLAIVDPGPAEPAHLDAIAEAIGDASVAAILLTHEHADHAGAADALAARTSAPVLGFGRGNLADGFAVSTDAGDVIALHTPGHSPDHASFHWPAGAAVFCGDLMMGGLETALVAPPEGSLAHYLDALERLRGLAAACIHPAHGPSFHDPPAALAAYVRHRAARQEQVLGALGTAARTEPEIAAAVYGAAVPPGLEDVALGAVRAYLEYLHTLGSVEPVDAGWRRT